MMDPRTGEIWALAQYPYFNPADCNAHFNDPLLIEHTRVKAVTDANEPGSVMKPFTIATALLANAELKKRGQKEIFDPSEKIDTSNPFFPGRSKPLPDIHYAHYLNMHMGMQKSSNIYMARLAERFIDKLGSAWYRNTLKDVFGFGTKTGIELRSETKGVLPTLGKFHPNGAPEWSKATPYSLAIGYNLQVNSLQMLRAYAVLLNGGYLVQPTLVRKIIKKDAEGKEVVLLDNTRPERSKEFPHVLPAEIGQAVAMGMKYATKPGGTCRRADIWGYTEGGKTGTTEKLDPKTGTYCKKVHITTFVGFTPAKDPAFLLLVAIDEPEFGYLQGIGKVHMGGFSAAPVFREIATRALAYLGVARDDPFGYPVGDPRYHPEKADWIPETRKLQALHDQWNHVSR
jgi:cell division protein FtsI (penicillin-binding protein 3)